LIKQQTHTRIQQKGFVTSYRLRRHHRGERVTSQLNLFPEVRNMIASPSSSLYGPNSIIISSADDATQQQQHHKMMASNTTPAMNEQNVMWFQHSATLNIKHEPTATYMFGNNNSSSIAPSEDHIPATEAVLTLQPTEADGSFPHHVLKIEIASEVNNRKVSQIISVGSEAVTPNGSSSMMVQNTFDRFDNLSDDQKLVLSGSPDGSNSGNSKRNANSKLIHFIGTIMSDGDHLDSGTCSDAETNNRPSSASPQPQPPPLPPKMGKVGQKHHLLSDSVCSDDSASSLSSDGIQYHQSMIGCTGSQLLSPDLIRSIDSQHKFQQSEKLGHLPTSLLTDIRNHSMKFCMSSMIDDAASLASSEDDGHGHDEPDNSNFSDLVISDVDDVVVVVEPHHHQHQLMSYQSYDDDKFYKFHINEHLTSALDQCKSLPSQHEVDEDFAGIRDLQNCTSTIRSAKGTVRGVKNRVRNGIATFLQMQQTTVKVSFSSTVPFVNVITSQKFFTANSH